MRRLFIAIPIPDKIKDEIVKARDSSGLSLKFIPAENLHITVLFLGNVTDPDLLTISTLLENAIQVVSSFNMILDSIDKKSNGYNNMLWVKFKKSQMFEELSHKVSEALRFPINRKPVPHINLVRSKHKIHGNFPLKLPEIEMKVTKVELWESTLNPSGATYSSLNSFTLKESKNGKEEG